MDHDIRGNALVIDRSSGIGLAATRALAEGGATLALPDPDDDALRCVTGEISPGVTTVAIELASAFASARRCHEQLIPQTK